MASSSSAIAAIVAVIVAGIVAAVFLLGSWVYTMLRLSKTVPSSSDVQVSVQGKDVFISHRGPDTKTVFVNLLADRLKGVGITVFYDKESLHSAADQKAWDIMKAELRAANIQIGVFSKNYLGSKWCKEELLIMHESPDKIMPIFYGVGTRGFGAASEKTGFIYNPISDDMAPFLEKVVTQVLVKLGKSDLPFPDIFNHDLSERIKTVSKSVESVGVLGLYGLSGMGGIGKTTLAQGVYNSRFRDFGTQCHAHVSFTLNPADEKADTIWCIRDMLDQLGFQGKKAADIGVAAQLANFLKGKRVLLLFDNANSSSQVDLLIKCCEGKMPGSLIIFTCRDVGYLGEDVTKHRVELMAADAAFSLMCEMANLGEVDKASDFGKTVTEAAQACGGLPLALQVLGRSLRGNFQEIWKEHGNAILVSGQGGPAIREVLDLSFKRLDRKAQHMLLDVVSVCANKPEIYLLAAWESIYGQAKFHFGNLISAALVSVVEGSVQIHDVLRDLGREKILWTTEYKGTRVWIEAFSKDTGMALRECTAMEISSRRSLKDEDEVSSEPCEEEDDTEPDELELGSKLQMVMVSGRIAPQQPVVFREVRWLKWPGLEIKLDWRSMQNLVYVHLSHTDITKLNGIEACTLLVYANFSWCNRLQALPEGFGALTSLKELYLRGCSSLAALPANLGALTSLHNLNLNNCSSLAALPESFGALTNLQELDLRECRSLAALPESFGALANLKELDLRECRSLAALPESFGALTNLKELDLRECRSLAALPESFGALTSLHKLNLDTCSSLAALPESFGALTSMYDLNLDNCSSLAALPENFGALTSLRFLSLRNCRRLAALPESFGALMSLRFLDLYKCPRLTALPESFGALMSLSNIAAALRRSLRALGR